MCEEIRLGMKQYGSMPYCTVFECIAICDWILVKGCFTWNVVFRRIYVIIAKQICVGVPVTRGPVIFAV